MKNIYIQILICLTLCGLSCVDSYAHRRVTQEHKDRAAEIVAQMTLEEKIAYIGGYESWYIRPVERL